MARPSKASERNAAVSSAQRVQNEKTDFRDIDRLVDHGREIDRLAIGPHMGSFQL